MKKFLGKSLVFSWLLLLVANAWSIPAPEQNYEMRQPDGTSIWVTKKGDERFHYLETLDGYPMTRDDKGLIRYIGDNGKPSSSKPHKKSDALRNYRQQIVDPIDPDAEAPLDSAYQDSQDEPGPLKMPAIDPNLKSGEKNALVVLVQFKDTKFSSENPQAVFDSLLNQENYSLNGNQGSAREYYVENSMGIFVPHYDVVGPFTVSNTANYYGERSRYGTRGAQYALREALDSLKAQNFDFTKYDNDNNRYLDFVHMIYAGFGSHDSKQDSAIWPHKWILSSPYRISVSRKSYYVQPYACSAELDGYSRKQDTTLRNTSGVGQFLHEFSHLLGLSDLYSNTDSIYTPSSWDIMDAGAYNRTAQNVVPGTTPPYFSAFERLSLGWISTTELNIKGTVKLSGIQNNVALQVTNPKNSDEMFLMEYRTPNRWDKGLPNHGMLIWHIDYKEGAWDSVKVNTTTHQHVDIEEAAGNGSAQNRARASFPGSSRIRSFNKFITWDSTDLNISISNITESRSYSYVTFNVDMEADSGSIDLMEGTAEELMEVPSDTLEEDPEEVISSSSESEISSDSEPEAESSSSSPWIEITDTDAINGNKIQTSYSDGQIKTLQVFSMNGQLLFQEDFTVRMPTAKLRDFRQPLLLSVSRNGKKVGRSLFIFRE